ncbi:hypothetical protein BJN45_10300 [Azonexus hydrophilus]|uniref:Uncharacterized protein n=1 Tax=Azonexus hydrophilus TaxID=418702 RepID=A0A1R1I509_9RHOO|nr:hypothetical protein [Azonexus hydrophilus]OMG53805.1 hypothetical protein BJN45_10300 [Azonexus hydrophilus]
MKKKLHYEHVDRKNLAVYLGQHEILSAEASDGSHIYRCLAGREETLVIALPDGNALIVSCESQAALDRRRLAR